MAVSTTADIFETALWPQRDARDPLGVWAARAAVVGDASGGDIHVLIGLPQDRRAAHVYTCISVTGAFIAPTASTQMYCRFLTNWPDASVVAGVTGFATNRGSTLVGGAPAGGTSGQQLEALIWPGDDKILLFDPRPGLSGRIDLIDLSMNLQGLADVYIFEAYGYYWDRAILNTPGGPRFPGSD